MTDTIGGRTRGATRIAVTGFGAVTPHGGSAFASWNGVRCGRRAMHTLPLEALLPTGWTPPGDWPLEWRRWAGGRVPADDADVARCMVSPTDPVVRYAHTAVAEAVEASRLGANAVDPARVATVIGTSKGGLASFANVVASVDPLLARPQDIWGQLPPDCAARSIAAHYGWCGPSLSPVAACATGLMAMIRGAALIREGACDVAVAGSSDASLLLAVLASFRRLGVLAAVDDHPELACRPFDLNRRGFLPGEGAGVLVLERWEHAIARGAPIHAEWVDGLFRSDPAGITVLPEDPRRLSRLIADLLIRCAIRPADVDLVSLHGTGTEMNDRYEARGLRQALGPALDAAACFGIKGSCGHLLGAAGSVETVIGLHALRDQIAPPTVNCDNPDPELAIPLDHAQATSRPAAHLLKLSLGFGGHLAAAVLRRTNGN
ncbi:MAG: beta-ketoacyl-[acyl-carrier-protein] synthase family protein [Planctomycetaceae bacterium]